MVYGHPLFFAPWQIHCFISFPGTFYLPGDCDVLPVPGQVFTVYRTVDLPITPSPQPSLLKEKYMSVLYRLLRTQ